MKKYLALLTLICITTIALYSCSKRSKSLSPPISYSMSATITKSANTTFFSASGASNVYAVYSNSKCTIFANDTSGKPIASDFTFTIFKYTGPGTYVFDSTSFPSIAADYETIGTTFTQTAFAYDTITITSVSGENISGTFSGTLTDGSVVTNGKFTALGKGF